ncbi:MAG TPA: hypothetical protein VJ377_04340 [Dehalococcoidales bacterium]|nr:MAG: hypothetical protein A2Z05_01375 [Chloroflexi bacterium RBG_16_60_22]HJX12738.1 hypothetical protein [Dehalococcoidales bacterium]
MRFIKAVPQLILVPAAVLGAAALVLFLIGAAQDYLYPPEHGPREYASIEEAGDELGFRVVVPTYFPSYLAWPPGVIRGQLLPSSRVETVYNAPNGGYPVLVISQVVADSDELPVPLPWVREVLEERAVVIGENRGTRLTATGEDGQPLNGAYWRSGGFYFIVVTSRAASELLSIASSM